MEINYYALIAAAFSSLFIGAIWYHPKFLGTVWMHASGLTAEKLKGANMMAIFGLVLVFGFSMAFILQFIVVHQWGALSATGGLPELAKPSYHAFMVDYGTAYRSFKHGALHGCITGLMFALPLLGINALFERKSWKYILVNGGYWIVTLGVMGSIVCGWV